MPIETILSNVVMTKEKEVDSFLNAVEKSMKDSKTRQVIKVQGRQLSDSKEIKRFLSSKRN